VCHCKPYPTYPLLFLMTHLHKIVDDFRWEVIATFIHQHQNSQNGREPKKRSAKDVLRKAKDLNTSDYSKNPLKKEINDQAFNIFQKNVKAVPAQSDLTKRDDAAEKSKSRNI